MRFSSASRFKSPSPGLSHGAFDGPSLSTLFRTVYLKVHLGSFEKLQDISRSEKLSKHVRYISYDGRILDASRVSPDSDHWMARNACSGMPYDQLDKDFLLRRFNQEGLHDFYQNYHQFLSGQHHMLKGDNENRMLRDALQNLPQLLGVECMMPDLYYPRHPYEPPPKAIWNSLSAVTQMILAGPGGYNGELESARHFWALLQSACLAGHAERLTHLHGEYMDLNGWHDAAASSLANYHGSFSSLQRLSLNFRPYKRILGGEATHIVAIIARAPSLRSLLLSFEFYNGDGDDVMSFPELVGPDFQLHHLHSLSLNGFAMPEARMRDGLRALRGTLRSLELADMSFCPGSWILFFKFLNKEMTLDHVILYCCFSNFSDERWMVRDEEYDPLPALAGASARDSGKYLVYRIERFITGRGRYPDPFTPRKKRDGDLKKYGYSLPWAFEQDRSWYHWDTLQRARKW
ncbi:F-box domain, cyclin-like protein [Metarhizium brunneum]